MWRSPGEARRQSWLSPFPELLYARRVGLSLAWFVVAVSTTAITGAALGYIAWRENDRALKLWSAAWLSWAVAGVSLMIIGEQQAPPLAAVLSGLVWVASALFFLRGTYVFAGRELPRLWYAVAALAVASAISLGMGPAAPTGMIPLMLFQSVGLLVTGVLLVRSERRHTGAWLAGGALVLLALHVLDAPLLAHHPYWFQWGFVLATALQMVAALGMLMLYYEQARVRLLATERALEETRRLETLGRVAGGVAHDFNNVLTIVRGHLDLMRLTQQSLQNEHLSAIEAAIDQAGRLTRQLLAFGRRSVLQTETADVQAVIGETLQLLAKVTPRNIRLRFSAKPDDYRARLDRVLLEQIVVNLVTNARDAIVGNGEIHVELARVESTPPTLMLRVDDDGLGMDEETKHRIFEPFFTTKRPGQGTGLGLASVHGAVTQVGGVIKVESQLGRGTRFEVRLPWLLPVSSSDAQSAASAHRPLDVVVVDDEDRVREITCKMLESGGHRVREATNGRHALEVLAEGPCDLVLSDVVMPEVSGVDLAREVATRFPATLVVLTSGHPFDERLDEARVAFLPKPFERQALLDEIARLAHKKGLR